MHEPTPLREQLRLLLHAERLDDAQLARLQSLSRRAQRQTHRRWWVAAAAILLAVTGSVLFVHSDTKTWQLDQIARHVSHYHLQPRPLEVESASLAAVQTSLDRLDFRLLLPRAASDWQLLGGRHCTLLGGVASQLLFQTRDGARITLYEAAFDPERFAGLPEPAHGEPPLEVAYRGLRIRVWVESGLVMAEVRESESLSRTGLKAA